MQTCCRRNWLRAATAAFMIVLAASGPARAQTTQPVIFAAASLKNALDDIAAQWKAETGKNPAISYAASSALAKQIEQGAPADMFISADLDWMDYLQQRNLIKPATCGNLLANRIVLIAAKESKVTAKIAPGFDLASLLGTGRLAMADTIAVPAGKYGKAALEALKVWPSVEGKIAQAENVRAALLLVSRGEAPLGIVYQTDAAADPNVKIVDAFPQDTHPPIVYPIALTAGGTNPDAPGFLAYLKSAKAKPLFEKQGFSVLN
ncbi:MAG: molybdate ABC transporter substrate-binding protein [Alphaproteobacteria bacterium]|nr:molybdate ABC transporter substrate-binding protein [Alphaproteobacteria bacterium]